jgi:hypothetical protein
VKLTEPDIKVWLIIIDTDLDVGLPKMPLRYIVAREIVQGGTARNRMQVWPLHGQLGLNSHMRCKEFTCCDMELELSFVAALRGTAPQHSSRAHKQPKAQAKECIVCLGETRGNNGSVGKTEATSASAGMWQRAKRQHPSTNRSKVTQRPLQVTEVKASVSLFIT